MLAPRARRATWAPTSSRHSASIWDYHRDVRILSLASCVVLAGCGLTDFDISQPLPEQEVSGSPVPSPISGLFPLPLNVDLTTKIRKQTTGPIDSVNLTSLSLKITGTQQTGDDFDDWAFIDEIHVFVKSTMDGSTLERVEIAGTGAPGEVQQFSFEVLNVNLRDYVAEGSVVETEGFGTLPPDPVSYDGQAVFTVHPL